MSTEVDGAPAKVEDHGGDEARQIAEAARESEWKGKAFARDLYLGRFLPDLVENYPDPDTFISEEAAAFIVEFEKFVREEVDGDRIDREKQIPPEVVERLKEMGAFGLKIPKEYGGKGFHQTEYNRAMPLLKSVDASDVTLHSGHQSIGLPQPLLLAGTDEQKKRYLPELAAGAISGLALTEDNVGSDPGRLATVAEPTEDGKAWILNGEKLWCTNGSAATYIVVLAKTPGKRSITAFVVDTKDPGVEMYTRSRFMGLNGMENGAFRLKDVRVPNEDVIWDVGKGLKLALMTLNTGRMTVPAMAVGATKSCLEMCRRWASTRIQWGRPVGKHEAVASMIADVAAHAFAMEAISDLGGMLADLGGYDIRLEAALAKLYCTEHGWRVIDETMQVMGGRGYETADSLRERGDHPVPLERMFRDFRVNRIFEGSSEILRLFIAREALDKHLQVAGAMVDAKAPFLAKLKAFPKVAAHYAVWYPAKWLSYSGWPRYSEFGGLATHVRYVHRTSRRLARAFFHKMIRHGAGLEQRQGIIYRGVDIGSELFAMSAVIGRARMLRKKGAKEADRAEELADLLCRMARRRVKALFAGMRSNDDRREYKTAVNVLDGRHEWLEEGIVSPYPEE